jgi:hypothetical protein
MAGQKNEAEQNRSRSKENRMAPVQENNKQNDHKAENCSVILKSSRANV